MGRSLHWIESVRFDSTFSSVTFDTFDRTVNLLMTNEVHHSYNSFLRNLFTIISLIETNGVWVCADSYCSCNRFLWIKTSYELFHEKLHERRRG